MLAVLLVPLAISLALAVREVVRRVTHPERPSLFARWVEEYGRDPATIGDSRDFVIRWIGEPDASGLFPDWDMAYPLGSKGRARDGKQDWLVLRLREGVVAETAVIRR
jgi:hypothetical protein